MESSPIQYLEEDIPCLRCKAETAYLVTRKEKFCKNCFIRFIRGKQRKQMQDEKYKVKYGRQIEKVGHQKVLLTLSGGISSLVLLDVMASLLQEQSESHDGKQGFELVILALDEHKLSTLNRHIKDVLPELVAKYTGITIKYKVLSLDSYILDQGMIQKIMLNKEFTGFVQDIPHDQTYSLIDLLEYCPNKSSVEDLLTIIQEELVLRTASIDKCQTILYGHSMTRIANEIIALTVKGRGSDVYRAISDHIVDFRGEEYNILFPLRDVLFAEIVAYSKITELEQFQVESTIKKSKITKNLTIRDITTNYFSQLDATGYASTASTVVKTGEKLGKPKFDTVLAHCKVCGVNIYQDPREWLRKITVNNSAPLETDEENGYLAQYKDEHGDEISFDSMDPIDICYGCIVTLGGVKQDYGFLWPIKDKDSENEMTLANRYVVSNDEEDRQRILDEYILTDDED